MIETIIAGATLYGLYKPTRDFSKKRLRFVPQVQGTKPSVIAGAATAVALSPIVAFLPVVGALTAIGAGVGVGAGLYRGTMKRRIGG